MLQSLKNIFANKDVSQVEENNEIDILVGLLVEAANTDGNITQDELNKISFCGGIPSKRQALLEPDITYKLSSPSWRL